MKKFINYIILSTLFVVGYSCDKELSALPQNEKVDGTTVVDQATAQIALNGVYYYFANVQSSSNITQWLSHEVYPGYLSGYLGYGYGLMILEDNNNTGGFESCWTECYKCINAANGVIKSVEAIADSKFLNNRKKEILGECRFLRAYNNYRLLSYFGEWYDTGSIYGILLRNELSALSNISKARSNVSDSYQTIFDDLDYAITNAPDSNANYYATNWATMALKLRVLISRGSQADYTEAVTVADNIIQNGPYTLETNVKDIFYSKGLSSNEVILGVKPQTNQESYYYILSRQYASGASSFYVAKQALKDLFANDPRGSWVVGAANPYAVYSPNTYYFTKYIAEKTTPTQLSEVAYAFRLSEVYLLKSEALIRLGGEDNLSKARAILKTIQGHAGLTDFSVIDNAKTAEALLLQNYYEIVRSLIGEDGQDWQALTRLPFETVKQLRPTIIRKVQFYFPVPTMELQNNPLFGTQNPGYSY